MKRALKIPRRALLGAGGAALALPLLRSLEVRAADPAWPLRFVVFNSPNGTVTKNWFPTVVRSEEDFDLGKIHEPLAPYKDRLLLVSGVNCHVGLSSKGNGGPHQRGIGALFTGQTLAKGEFVDGCGSQAGWARGPSLDQVIAEKIGGSSRFRSLELGVRCMDNDVQGRISYSGPEAPLPPTNDPALLYERLFQRTPAEPGSGASRKAAVLDTVFEQFGTLRPKLSTEDRDKLDAHTELVRDLERRLGIGADGEACLAPEQVVGLNPDSEVDMPKISRAHLDLLATAIACDLTRVASVQYSTGFNRIRYPWLDEGGEGHSLSHSGDSDTASWDILTGRARWHMAEIAYFMERLAAIPEGDGTALDHTVILWGTEVSQGNTHSLSSIPYLLIGDAGGVIKTGRYLTFEDASSVDYLATIAAAFDSTLADFGDIEFKEGLLTSLYA